jgi:hypothetical protein
VALCGVKNTVNVVISIATPPSQGERAPVHVACVLDKSGSMQVPHSITLGPFHTKINRLSVEASVLSKRTQLQHTQLAPSQRSQLAAASHPFALDGTTEVGPQTTSFREPPLGSTGLTT